MGFDFRVEVFLYAIRICVMAKIIIWLRGQALTGDSQIAEKTGIWAGADEEQSLRG